MSCQILRAASPLLKLLCCLIKLNQAHLKHLKTSFNVIFTLNCQSPAHREANMGRQFCKQLSQWTVIVGDFIDFKTVGCLLEYTLIQTPTGRTWKVITTLKDGKNSCNVCNLFPISWTEIKKNLRHSVGMRRTVDDTVKPPYHPSTKALHIGNIHYVQRRILLRCQNCD